MGCVIFFLSFIPAVIWILYFYFQDRYEKEPFKLILWSFVLGCLSVIPAIGIELFFSNIIEYHMPFSPSRLLVYMLMVAITEEICKYAAVRFAVFNNPEFNEPMDGIVYAVTVAMGFAFLENIGYMVKYQMMSGPVGAVFIGVMRAVFSMFGHASFGVIMGYYLGKAKFEPQNRKVLLVKGIILASLVHCIYNYTLVVNKAILGALMVLPAFFLIWRNMNRVQMDDAEDKSPFKPEGDHFVPKTWKWRVVNVLAVLVIIAVVAMALQSFNSMVTFREEEKNYSVQHPTFWQRKVGKNKKTIEIIGPKFKNSNPRVKIDFREVGSDFNPQTEMSKIVSTLDSKMKSFKKRETGKIEINGIVYPAVTATWIKKNDNNETLRMKTMLTIIHSNGRLARFYCTSREVRFEGFKKTFEKIVRSFKFL